MNKSTVIWINDTIYNEIYIKGLYTLFNLNNEAVAMVVDKKGLYIKGSKADVNKWFTSLNAKEV